MMARKLICMMKSYQMSEVIAEEYRRCTFFLVIFGVYLVIIIIIMEHSNQKALNIFFINNNKKRIFSASFAKLSLQRVLVKSQRNN